MKNWHYFLVAITFLFVDQLIKNLATKNTLPELGGYLTNHCNPNIAWGIPLNGLFFWIIWIFIFFLISYNLKKYFNPFLLLVLFGAISNIIDRIWTGCVIDYINLPYFPVFNIADAMITIGITLFIFQDFLKQKENT